MKKIGFFCFFYHLVKVMAITWLDFHKNYLQGYLKVLSPKKAISAGNFQVKIQLLSIETSSSPHYLDSS